MKLLQNKQEKIGPDAHSALQMTGHPWRVLADHLMAIARMCSGNR